VLFKILLTASLIIASSNPVKAEDLLDFLFGSGAPQKTAPPANRQMERTEGTGEETEGSAEAGPSTGGYCVRTCDGYFFPLIKSSRASKQESCEFACPSSPVEIYDGGSIKYARNQAGQRYSAQPFAFAFRTKTVANCNCNNPQSAQSDSVKLSRNDPTLASGDIVIEDTGAFVYDGTGFVPLALAKGVSNQTRQRILSMIKGNGDKTGRPADAGTAVQQVPMQQN
jgi:Protein of unknown function (DUF2865)